MHPYFIDFSWKHAIVSSGSNRFWKIVWSSFCNAWSMSMCQLKRQLRECLVHALKNMCFVVWKHVWKYMWMKKCVEISVMLFENIFVFFFFEMVYQTPHKLPFRHVWSWTSVSFDFFFLSFLSYCTLHHHIICFPHYIY